MPSTVSVKHQIHVVAYVIEVKTPPSFHVEVYAKNIWGKVAYATVSCFARSYWPLPNNRLRPSLAAWHSPRWRRPFPHQVRCLRQAKAVEWGKMPSEKGDGKDNYTAC